MPNLRHQSRWGERNPHARLTEEQVRAIRSEYKPHVFGVRRLAKKYGCSKGAIEAVIHHVNWAHVQ